MPDSTLLVARRLLLALALATPFAAVQAQNAPATAPAAADPSLQNQEQQADGRRNQKIEHLHTEDNGASVDEVRYGGRTQSINVTPKANMPGYQVLPNDPSGARPNAADGPAGTSPRVWNVMKF